MTPDPAVSDHYEQADLIARIEQAVIASGRSTTDISVEDLAPADEFHVGGLLATETVMSRLGLGADMHVLDIGSGLGGPARFCAQTYGCRVTGIDLTASYVDAARVLTGWVGLSDRVSFRRMSALDLRPEENGATRLFDAAYLLHVGMNIADKTELFDVIGAVLRPGAPLAIYDLMRIDTGDLSYPMPWATAEASSFVETQASYETSLVTAGFELVTVADRSEIAAAFIKAGRAQQAAAAGPPPLGLHLAMGPEIGTKVANLSAALGAQIVAPIEIVARRPLA